MRIYIKIWIFEEPKHQLSPGGKRKYPTEEERDRKRQARLASDFGKLYEDSSSSDVTVLAGGEVFKAHKAVLIARSSVFAAMFSTDMLEKQKNTLEIQDFEAEIVKGMLEHVYKGKTEVVAERAPELLQVAEKYDLAGLKEDAEFAAADELNLENAAELLVLADIHNAAYLKSRASDFINT